MIQKVLQAHTNNQKKLREEVEAINECGRTKDEQALLARSQNMIYTATSPQHKLCRSGEAGKFTEKRDIHNEMKDKLKLKELKCKEFANAGRMFATQKANAEVVKKGGSEEDESYIRRVTATFCGQPNTHGRGGAGQKGFLDEYLLAKHECEVATKHYNDQVKLYKKVSYEYANDKSKCDSLQDKMDGASCKRATLMKDACESYSECHMDRKRSHEETVKMVKTEEHDRKAEWRGLMRMQCLIKAFKDGRVKNREIKACRKATHSTDHLIIDYPQIPQFQVCSVPNLYPATPAYKLAEFAPLPAFAKGKQDANTCVGIIEINTEPNPGPRDGNHKATCHCERVTLNGPYSAGALVKCTKCRSITGPRDINSCPEGTKLFSPRSELDWKTVAASVELMVQDPSDERNSRNASEYVIVDVSSPRTVKSSDAPMNSHTIQGVSWHTADHSAWWLRDTVYKQNGTIQPHGGAKGYTKGCYLGVKLSRSISAETPLEFESRGCMPNSDSYFCQAIERSMLPKPGSPEACKCDPVVLTGHYSAGALIKCTNCLDVSKSTQKNSCPMGTKLFSPQSSADWKTFLASAGPLRSPHWIIDVTRPQNGCGGCSKHSMKSSTPAQMTWKTADGSPWWLRSTSFSEPNGDYKANCYLGLKSNPVNEQGIKFNDWNCNFHSNAYFCQPVAPPPGGTPGMPASQPPSPPPPSPPKRKSARKAKKKPFWKRGFR